MRHLRRSVPHLCRILCRTKEKERKMKIDFKNLKLDVRYLDINLTKPFARNPRTHSKEQIQQITTSMMKFGWVKNSFALSWARYQHQHEWMAFGNTESVYKEQHECILLGKNHDSLIHWTCTLLLSMLCVTKDNLCGHLNVKSWF